MNTIIPIGMSHSTEERMLLTLPQAARELAVSKRTLERLIAAGEFPSPVKIGRSSRIPSTDLTTYLGKLLAQRGMNPGSS